MNCIYKSSSLCWLLWTNTTTKPRHDLGNYFLIILYKFLVIFQTFFTPYKNLYVETYIQDKFCPKNILHISFFFNLVLSHQDCISKWK